MMKNRRRRRGSSYAELCGGEEDEGFAMSEQDEARVREIVGPAIFVVAFMLFVVIFVISWHIASTDVRLNQLESAHTRLSR